MSNTVRKSSLGLWVLSAVALIVFLFIKLFNPPKNQNLQLPLPQRDNNPFAIIQDDPSNWVGLIGKEKNGFLKFDSPVNGVRAGFINLFNHYISQGMNTINLMAETYSGGDGNYAAGLSKISKLPADSLIEWPNDCVAIGRAIERMENGSQWVSEKDFNEGLLMARKYLQR